MKINVLLAALLFCGFATANAQDEPQAIPGQFIVVLKETAAKPIIKNTATADRDNKESENKAARDANMAVIQGVYSKKGIKESAIVNQFADVLVGFTAQLSDSEKTALSKDPAVKGVYQDYIVSLGNPQVESIPGDINAQSQSTTCAVTKAGGPLDGSNKATWIWILDTGIDLDHPDLNVQTSATFAKSFIAGQSVDDGNGHGTHCAGISAAKNNAFGVVGVSAGARVVPVKVLSNSGSGAWSGLISGLNHVAQYDIPGDVVNMSLGGYGYSNCENSNPTLRDAIRNLGLAGTHVVMAAGNNSANAAANLPGCINGTRVYTVGSITCSNTCSSFSNWAKPPVDWAAVGSSVYSTYMNGGYATLSGTSMAAPVVAGVIHARNGAPLSAGNVTCAGAVYPIAKR